MEAELPEGWKLVKLKDVCKVIGGSTPKTSVSENWNGEILWATPKDLSGFSDLYLEDTSRKITKKGYESCGTMMFPEGTVLMSSRAPIGYLAIAAKPMCTNQGFKSFVCSEKINNKYLYYYLKSKVPELQSSGSGTTFNEISKKKAENIDLILPPMEDQLAIVKILEQFFSEYEVLKAEKQKAREQHEKILQSAIGKLVESKDVTYEPLDDLFDINPSKRELKDLDENTEVSFIPMKAVSDTRGAIIEKGTRKLKEVIKGYTYFGNNDVLFAKITPCMENGKIAIARDLSNAIGFGTTEFHVFRSKGKVLPEFLYYFLRQKSFRAEARMNMTGTAGQLRVPTSFLKKYKFPVLPLEEQREITRKLKEVRTLAEEIDNEYSDIDENVDNLPHSVLTKAFQGELVHG